MAIGSTVDLHRRSIPLVTTSDPEDGQTPDTPKEEQPCEITPEAEEESGDALEGQSNDHHSEEAQTRRNTRWHRWRARESISTMCRETVKQSDMWDDADKRDNDASRLPPGEQIHLGGIVLAEAFTPSTAFWLRKSLERFPAADRKKEEWLLGLENGRSATGSGGWTSLGMVRRPGAFGFDSFDPDIPDVIEAIWPRIYYSTPSLTIAVATFTLREEEGDLTGLLSADYSTSFLKPTVHVEGWMGRIRRHIWWSRPKGVSLSNFMRRANENRMLACESMITQYEEACIKWFSKRFPGRFAADGKGAVPTVRIFFTKDKPPFTEERPRLTAVDLSEKVNVWRSVDQPGWFLSSHKSRSSRYSLIAAARRSDAAQSPGGGEIGDSTWWLTQKFARNQPTLISHWAITCLLSTYANRLASLRDRAGRRHRPAMPVREAKDFDKFLISDGLDASTIISDLNEFTAKENGPVQLGAEEYVEDLSRHHPGLLTKQTEAAKLSSAFRVNIQAQSNAVRRDMDAATSNIAASAELRQAIANTRLQRFVILLTVITIIIALLGLYKQGQPSGVAPQQGPSPTATQAPTEPTAKLDLPSHLRCSDAAHPVSVGLPPNCFACSPYILQVSGSVVPSPRRSIVPAASVASRPGRYAVASRALTWRTRPRDRRLSRKRGRTRARNRSAKGRGSRRSALVFVSGFVNETRRDAPRRGGRARSTETNSNPSAEVNATTGDSPRRRRRTSYCS
jgi:hypothetical protein